MSKDNRFSSKFKHDSSESIGFVFMKTYATWNSLIKNSLKQYSITHPQFIILTTLAYLSEHFDEVTQVTLSQHANIDVVTVSQILDNLEKKILVKRIISVKDSRAKSIQLTDNGYIMVNKTTPLVEKIDKQFFSCLGEDITNFHKMLLKLS